VAGTIEESVVRVILRGEDESGPVRDGATRLIKKIENVNGVLTKTQTIQKKVRGEWENMGKKQEKVIKQQERFRFELLGTMFFGMAVEKFFGKWVQGADQMLGATDLLNQALSLMTLQALMPFKDTIFDSIKSLFGLDDANKQVIGSFILSGYALGKLGSGLSQTLLGLSSLKILLGASLFGSLMTFGGILLLILLGAIGLGLAIYGAAKAIENIQSVMNKVKKNNYFGVSVQEFGESELGKTPTERLSKLVSDPLGFLSGAFRTSAWYWMGAPKTREDALLLSQSENTNNAQQTNNISINMPQNATEFDAQKYMALYGEEQKKLNSLMGLGGL